MLFTVPTFVAEGPDGIYGDQEKFFKSVEEGIEAGHYEAMIAAWSRTTDDYIRGKMCSVVIPGCI